MVSHQPTCKFKVLTYIYLFIYLCIYLFIYLYVDFKTFCEFCSVLIENADSVRFLSVLQLIHKDGGISSSFLYACAENNWLKQFLNCRVCPKIVLRQTFFRRNLLGKNRTIYGSLIMNFVTAYVQIFEAHNFRGFR